jgi:hypothetical protein
MRKQKENGRCMTMNRDEEISGSNEWLWRRTGCLPAERVRNPPGRVVLPSYHLTQACFTAVMGWA